MKKNIVIAIVLGVLVLIAMVQAYQLVGIKNQISGGSVQTEAAPASAPSSGSPKLPSNLENLPGMVGGC